MRLPKHPRTYAAFTIAEVLASVTLLAIACGSLVALNGYAFTSLRRGVVASYASQLIQERMEQFRRAAWTEITCNYPPAEDDPEDVEEPDPEAEPYYEDPYPTKFPYDAAELDALEPGMKTMMALGQGSAAQLADVKETVRVEAYNASNAPITIFEADGSTITIPPFSVGGTPILVDRQNGAVTVRSHNPVMVFNTTVRLTLTVSWRGTDNVTRTKETVTLFTVEGDK